MYFLTCFLEGTSDDQSKLIVKTGRYLSKIILGYRAEKRNPKLNSTLSLNLEKLLFLSVDTAS